MALTSIGDQKTPGRPVEITFAAETGTPSSNQELLLIGRASGTATAYEVTTISNAGDLAAASGEVATKFGDGSELAKMVLAAVRANQGGSTFPAIKCVKLAADDVDFGAADAALTAAAREKAEFMVSPFDGEDTTLGNKLKATADLMSGAQRVENDQYGTFGVVANMDVADPADLPKYDSQYMIGIYMRDTGTGDDLQEYSLGEIAAAAAARMAANGSPFNPLDNVTVKGITAPAKRSDWITVGAGLESETVLDQGWTPLKVKPNGEVAFVRTVTSRLTVDADGVTDVTAYYDVQDFQVLFFWRKTIFTRFNQTDMKTRKASATAAQDILSELIRLAELFQAQGMFQAVTQLAKTFQVERSTSDRHRFDVKTPVNVIPGLHMIASNVEATTEFDSLSI